MGVVTFFAQKVFIISFGKIGLMFLLCFFCLFTRKYKTGLLQSYLSISYWGFFPNRGHWLGMFGDNGTGIVLYSAQPPLQCLECSAYFKSITEIYL